MTTTHTPEPGELISVTAAAQILGVSRWTVYNRIADGDLPAYRVGSSPRAAHRVKRSDLAALIQRRRGY